MNTRLDLPEIEKRLKGLSGAVSRRPGLWAKLRQEPLDQDVVRRLYQGYVYLDDLLARSIDPLALGNSECLLELNHIVLCGLSPETRAGSAKHIALTEEQFYDNRRGGIGDVHDWYERHRRRNPVDLFCGLFVQIVSRPQLFIEGNQRTAAIAGSYYLVNAGFEPCVVGSDDFSGTFRLFAAVKALNQNAPLSSFRSLYLERRLRHWYLTSVEALDRTSTPSTAQ